MDSNELEILHQGVTEQIRTLCGSLREGSTVALFGGLRSEPDLVRELSADLQSEGLVVAVFAFGDGVMTPWRTSWPQGLLRSAQGVWVPSEDASVEILATELDVVFVPGLAFSRNGDRLGRGGGYYDRLLAEVPSTTRVIGVCSNEFLLEDIPMEAHDRRVPELVTESGLLVCRAFKDDSKSDTVEPS